MKYAAMPLDDEVIDLLLERSPRLIEECRKIREQVRAGHYKTLDEVKQILGLDKRRTGRRAVRRK